MWLLLSGFSMGQFFVGTAVALLGGWMMRFLEPETIRVKNWNPFFRLLYRIFVDSITSNIAVAWFILTKKHSEQQSGFVVVPLSLKNRTSLAILACILSAVPGTIWVAYNSKNNKLLIHVLNLNDGNNYPQFIKQRYEQLLLEIFS
ncbi:Na(+) H(+) antiporter subunit E [Bartonella ancashensis]|uniref:Na(+) H(+) antiporter subunit E n=2 Tax=Bartonella ancashensis TaxID=1318743 RepID=A0A0M4L7L5_9HYPH|nr:Na(+) H(+) antiporter subunit E [Bartonella ancashensis]